MEQIKSKLRLFSIMASQEAGADSEDGPITFEYLEPSPVDDAAQVEQNGYFPSAPKRPALPNRSSTLGLSGHNAVYYRKNLSPIDVHRT